ncbi:hypothetical protein [Spirosoma spitsbergense]|uniref:hypothetical protein n=1 Tax=Spirosoma spitsbergense TaxID=431554 RepID=UPI0003612087|nr:hypothetical protein [Spirosoma spitsbergense]
MKLDNSLNVPVRTPSIMETIAQPDWSIEKWQIHFLLSEKYLHQVKKLSKITRWYDDPVIVDTCHDRLRTCFQSIRDFHDTFGILPQVGDRLYDEDSGLLVQDRSIDGGLRVITFTLSI